MWLLKTIFISSILGISLGTIAGLTARLFSTNQTRVAVIQPKKIILASENNNLDNLSKTEAPTVGHEIIASQVVIGDEKVDVPTPEPTIIPTPIPVIEKISEDATSSATSQPIPSPTTQNQNEDRTKPGLDANLLFSLINQHREKLGLADFIKDDNLCTLAQTRSKELGAEFDHGKLHSGLYNRDLPYWISENAILMKTELQALNWWLHSAIHRHSIEGDAKYSCLACSGTQCSELFTNFTPKN